jgi:hypothetical protein
MATSPSTVATADPARAAENNLPRILGVLGTFHGLAILAVILRVYTRVIVVKAFGRDDIAIVLCSVSLLFVFSCDPGKFV